MRNHVLIMGFLILMIILMSSYDGIRSDKVYATCLPLIMQALPDKSSLALRTFVLFFSSMEFYMSVPASLVPESSTTHGAFEWKLVTVYL